MAKKEYSWKDWWKEVLTKIPLTSTIFIAWSVYGFWATVIVAVIVLYVGNLYDKLWQKKINTSFSTFQEKEHNIHKIQ